MDSGILFRPTKIGDVITEFLAPDTGRRFAFAPAPNAVEIVPPSVNVIFEKADQRLQSAGTDLIAAALESAQDLADGLKDGHGLDSEAWIALADRVFAVRRKIISGPESVRDNSPN